MAKVMAVADAVKEYIKDGSTITFGGFIGSALKFQQGVDNLALKLQKIFNVRQSNTLQNILNI